MKRQYHPYTLWEDYKHGMWRVETKENEKIFLDKAIQFTGDHLEYGSYMMRVAKEWKIACEHNLSDLSQNRRAWIGHAACCMAIRCPEYITRLAWGCLTDKQRYLANKMADKAIEWWESNMCGVRYEQDLFGL